MSEAKTKDQLIGEAIHLAQVWADDCVGAGSVKMDRCGTYLRMLAAIDQLAAHQAEGWQPIETAPKDGTAVYVVVSDALKPEAGVAYWFSGTWRGGQDIDWQDTENPHEHFGVYPSPTHWMPLPAAPPIPSNGGAGEAL